MKKFQSFIGGKTLKTPEFYTHTNLCFEFIFLMGGTFLKWLTMVYLGNRLANQGKQYTV